MEVVLVHHVGAASAAVDVAHLASELAGSPVTVARLCPRCGATDHGRPVADRPDIHVSLSRHGVEAIVAAARVPIGIDAVATDAVSPEHLAGAGLPSNGDPAAAWAHAEAVAKLTGRGIAEHDESAAHDVVVTDVSGPHGLIVALATWEPVEIRFVTREREVPSSAARG